MQSKLAILLAGVLSIMSLTLTAAAKSKSTTFLGIVPGEITSAVAEDYGVKAGEGVIVEGVTDGSPADEIGLRTNDVITQINGATVTGPEELRHLLSKQKPKDTVDLTYYRGGKPRTVAVTLSGREEDRQGWAAPRAEHFEGPWAFHFFDSERDKDRGYAGLYLQELSDGLKGHFKVEEGVLISDVVDDSPAAKAGLKAGDVIVSVGGDAVEDEGDVRREIRRHKPGETLEFKVKRDGVEQTITVTLGDAEDSPDWGDIRWGEVDGRSYAFAPQAENLDQLRAKLRDLKVDIHGGTMRLEGLQDLDSKLKDFELRLDDLPPLQLELDEPGTPAPLDFEMRKARPIWDRTVWMETWEKIKLSFEQQVDAWETGMARLKHELQDLREEIKQRFA